MAKFLKGNELNSELEKIFESAESQIILVSPYIQLHDRIKSTLLTKIDNPNIKIIILFGKNEDDFSRSMKKEDFDFFKQFPNIEIMHEKRLHAKYYANESTGILTSMNLYGFSQNNNIEVGVLTERTFKGSLTGANNLDDEAWEYFITVFEQADLLFEKRPVYDKNLLGFKKYLKSEVKIDDLSDFFDNKTTTIGFKKSTRKKENRNSESHNNIIGTGYCIRTGKEIPFNIEKPMVYEAFKMWNKYKNPDYEENYCHFSGEPSDGQTSVKQPVLKKNWKKAKQKYNL